MTTIGLAVLQEAYAKLGIKLETRNMPAERALLSSDAGFNDGEILRIEGIQKTYPNLVMVPADIFVTEGVAFSRTIKGRLNNGVADLKSYHVGIVRGIKFAERLTEGLTVTRAESNTSLFRLLDKGAIDVAIVARLSAMIELKKLGLTDIHVLEPPLSSYKMYHYLHKSKADIVPKLTAVLQEMKASGRMDVLVKGAITELLK